MNYIISYDLNKSNKNYEGLIDKIKEAGNQAWCKPCKSTWVIKSSLPSAKAVYDSLENEIDSDDYIIVAEITKNLYGHMQKKVADYLSEHFI